MKFMPPVRVTVSTNTHGEANCFYVIDAADECLASMQVGNDEVKAHTNARWLADLLNTQSGYFQKGDAP